MLEIVASLVAAAVWAGVSWAWNRWSGSGPTTLSLSTPPPTATPPPAETPPQPASPPTLRPPRQPAPPETAVWLNRRFIVYRHPWPAQWLDESGLYVLAHRDPESDQGWAPLLLRVVGSFAMELPNPPRWPEAQQRGATHLHVHQAASGEALRTFRERFVEEFQPPLNIEANTLGAMADRQTRR